MTSKKLRLLNFALGNCASRIGVLSECTNYVLDLTHPHFRLPKDIVSMMDVIRGGSPILSRIKDSLSEDFTDNLRIPVQDITFNSPVKPVRNIICIGKNYANHVAEIKNVDLLKAGEKSITPPAITDLPKSPVFFTKSTGTVIAHKELIKNHSGLTKYLDYEAELAVVIGATGRDIAVEDAHKYIFEYTIANDITARDLQKKHNQWFKGKSLDTTCPLGPFLVPASELDASDLSIKLWLNGELKQDSRTSNMIFKIADIIASLSEGFTLLPGDVILTGTPDGVGYAAKPPRTLIAGDSVRIEIEHLGALENTVH